MSPVNLCMVALLLPDGNMRVLVWFVVRLVRQVLVRLIVSPWANSGGSRVTQDYTMDMRSDDLDTLLTTVTYEAPRHQPHLYYKLIWYVPVLASLCHFMKLQLHDQTVSFTLGSKSAISTSTYKVCNHIVILNP